MRKQLKYHLSQPYDFVFFDGSHYGVYLREFARHGFKTICFFHNVEVDYYQQKYKTTHQPQDKLMVGFIAHNERCCIDHASYLITLNERDNLSSCRSATTEGQTSSCPPHLTPTMQQSITIP